MRVRLIQPPLVQPRYRQLTLPVVGACLAAEGLEVECNDENVQPLDHSEVDLVGISCHVYNAPRAFDIARQFRQRGIPVLLGGTFPTVAPKLCAPHCDSVVVGELEGLAAQIAADARAGTLRPLYRADSPPDLAHTPRPDFKLIDSSRYLRFNFPLEVSRGCRFACRFCTSHTLFPQPRVRSLADIERDLDQHDHGLVELIDVNFLNQPQHFDQVMGLLERASIPGWMGQTTVADLSADPTLPERLAKSGCRAVFVGLESLSVEGLRSVGKGWSKPADFLEVARRLRQTGVLVQAGIIVGLDHDRPGLLDRTADYLEQARVQTASITWLHYYPGTPPYEAVQRAGRLLSEDLELYDGNQPVIRPLHMSVEELQEELTAFLQRLYTLRSIGRRALHRGIRRHPVQLLHHLFVNGGLSHYYDQVGPGRPGRPAQRYQRSAPSPAHEKLASDVGAWILDRLWLR